MDVNFRKFLLTTVAVLAIDVVAFEGGANAQTAQPSTINQVLNGDGTLTVAGITVYGTIDAGLLYQSHGNPLQPFGSANDLISRSNNKATTTFAPNQTSASTLGIKGKESLAEMTDIPALQGWAAIFDLQIGFNPLSGQLLDNPRGLILTNGVPLANQVAAADGSRGGQIFNGEAYGGFKHDVYGQFTFGRQNTLLREQLFTYDPQALKFAFSALGFFGSINGGMGNTEDAILDSSFKYKNTIGPLHFGAQYGVATAEQGGRAYDFNVGVDLPGALKGLSLDGYYGKKDSGISAAGLSAADCLALVGVSGNCIATNVLNATVSNNEIYALMAKYGIGDATFSGGYVHTAFSNGASPLKSNTLLGGYAINTTTINYTNFTTDREQDVVFVGARYAFTPKLSGAIAYYHIQQNAFISKGKACTTQTLGSNSIQANCSGEENVASVSFDYQWTKRLALYAGIAYSQVDGGLAAGFLNKTNIDPTIGARLKF